MWDWLTGRCFRETKVKRCVRKLILPLEAGRASESEADPWLFPCTLVERSQMFLSVCRVSRHSRFAKDILDLCVLTCLLTTPYFTIPSSPADRYVHSPSLSIKMEAYSHHPQRLVPVPPRFSIPLYGSCPAWVDTGKRVPLLNGCLFCFIPFFFPSMQNYFLTFKHYALKKFLRLYCEIRN